MAFMRPTARHTLVLCLALGSSAFAQTMYKWTDKAGEVHYTDDKGSIPKGVKVETTEGGALSEMGEAPAKPVEAKPSATQVQGRQKAEDGPSNAELYWRSEYARAREHIHQLEDQIAEDTRKVEDPNALGMTLTCSPVMGVNNGFTPSGTPAGCYYLPNPEYERAKSRLETNKRALERAKADLHELDRRAANDAVPLEWRR